LAGFFVTLTIGGSFVIASPGSEGGVNSANSDPNKRFALMGIAMAPLGLAMTGAEELCGCGIGQEKTAPKGAVA
jgi:hypothetical protein